MKHINTLLLDFKVIPSVMPADKVSEIAISGDGEYSRFFDEIKYTVTVCPKEIHDIPISRDFTVGGYDYKKIEVYPKDGVIKFEYDFIDEQEWEIVVSVDSENAKEVLKRGYFDAMELLGGCTPHENNMQVALYNEMRADGIKIPVVASTDSHGSHNRGVSHTGTAKTLVFAENSSEIINSLKDFYSVAVEELNGESERVYGPFRMVKYAKFLIENYYPIHDRLCEASGLMLMEYFKGSVNLKGAIEAVENKIKEFENRFFKKCI